MNFFEKLVAQQQFYDVTLVPEDGKLEKAHKIVLSIRSTFYKMTTRGGLAEIIR